MKKSHSTVKGDHIEYSFWLAFDAQGGMRFSRGEPSTARGERAMQCVARLPRALFKTPELKASITVADHGPSNFSIDVEAAGKALRETLGVDLDLRVIPHDEVDP